MARSKKRNRFFPPILVAAAVLTTAVTFHQLRWLDPVEGILVRALSPLLSTAAQFGSPGFGLGGSSGALGEENARLQNAVQELAVENQRLKSQLKTMELLEEQTRFLEQRGQNYVDAHVIAREFSDTAQVLVIDRGRQSGVAAGAPVIARDGVLVGRVTEAGVAHAKVMLLSDGRSTVPARISQSDDVGGTVSGEFGPALRLELIPREVALQAGDLIVTSMLERDLPEGLVVGMVSRVAESPSKFFHLAYVQPLIPYHRITVVAVLVPPALSAADLSGNAGASR